MAFQDFGDFAEGCDGLIEVALVQFCADGGSNATAEGGRQYTAAVGPEESRRRHPLEPGLNRSACEAEPLGEDHDRQAGVLIKGEEDAAVRGIQLLLQSDQFLSIVLVLASQTDQRIVCPLCQL